MFLAPVCQVSLKGNIYLPPMDVLKTYHSFHSIGTQLFLFPNPNHGLIGNLMCCSEEEGLKKNGKSGPFVFSSYFYHILPWGVCPCPKALTLNKVKLQLVKT